MESFLAYLLAHDELRFILVFGMLALAVSREAAIPLFRFNYGHFKHIAFNLVFVLTTGLVTGLAAYIAFEIISIYDYRLGLLHLIDLPLWLEVVLSLIVLDFFGQYLIHVCLHRYKWLWKLHLVHHSDTTVDASTGTRHHPGDMLVRETLILTVIVLFGIHPAVYILYRIITPFFAYFTHANIALPDKLDRALSWVIVTPHMHKFHHHFERPWTDTNFGNILSCWDRLFGTFVYDDPRRIQYGVDTLDNEQDTNLHYQYTLPWNTSVSTDY